jgi:hypothetical protein
MRWIGNQECAAELGISVRQLQRLRASGWLLPGVHWLRQGTGPRSRLMFNPGACWLALQSRTATTCGAGPS